MRSKESSAGRLATPVSSAALGTSPLAVWVLPGAMLVVDVSTLNVRFTTEKVMRAHFTVFVQKKACEE